MQELGSQFLHQRNPELHATQEVEDVAAYLRSGGETIPNEPANKISAYLGLLADRGYVNDGILTGDQSSIDRQIETHVIKFKDVPEGYFELQRRIAREQGHGDVQITSEMRKQMTEAVQADQKSGLNKWVEYLGGNDGGYPNWFKHYTWTSVTKLGTYDKEKQEFQKRSRGTTARYPELNREALAYVYDVLDKSRVHGQKVDGGANNTRLQQLLNGGNFGKLYAHAALEITPDNPELRKDITGSWTKYNQTDDPRTVRRLSGSLQGHGTGWCTASESTAEMQLKAGDFYVYYTRDEEGKDTIPRVAIRMQNGEVAEVRGVNAAQELESELADTAAEKLKDLPGGEEYIRRAEDMKRLTAIEKKITTNLEAELSAEELRFLYELDHDIQGFGYECDPRIGEIRSLRGNRDKPELAHILPEVIREQLQSALIANQEVSRQLGIRQTSERELTEAFKTKEEEWRQNGIYDYLVEQLIENGSRYSLVATPNVAASEQQIVALAEAFGKQQPSETYVYDELYRQGRYTSEEWSGNSGNEAIKFSLIPSKHDTDLGYVSAEIQVQKLHEKQTAEPNLHLRVPSLLDAVTYWYTLRARGDKLDDATAFDKTYIWHFDLKPQELDGWLDVPLSFVLNVGQPYLDDSAAEFGSVARLAVG